MNERNELIKKLIEERGGSHQDYLNLLDSIAYHESAHTLDPTIKQKGGGPGRGKYQFEIGKHAGGITAAKRTKKYYQENNIPVPQWLKKASSGNDLDVSTLTGQQQDILFLGNIRKHPKANLSKLWKGQESVTDFWANYHWAGNIKDRAKRVKSFNESLEKLKKSNQIKPVPVSSELEGRPMDYILRKTNEFKTGGEMPSSVHNEVFNEFNEGGLHETNRYGGIPQGVGENGKLNTVEEGEASFNFDDGKYIFSNRLS